MKIYSRRAHLNADYLMENPKCLIELINKIIDPAEARGLNEHCAKSAAKLHKGKLLRIRVEIEVVQ